MPLKKKQKTEKKNQKYRSISVFKYMHYNWLNRYVYTI